MKLDTHRFSKKPVILGILVILISGLLAACGDDATSTNGPVAGATVAGSASNSSNGTTAASGTGTTVAGGTAATGTTVAISGGIPPVTGQTVKLASGLQYIDVKVGDGAEAKSGQTVTVHYTGWLAADGKKFDSSVDKGTPFPFPLGAGRVIKGWDDGVAGMKVGGKRRLIIPSDLGYGDGGYPPVIPAKATLVFDVELLGVK